MLPPKLRNELPHNCKETYVYALNDVKRVKWEDISELTEKMWSIRYLENMGEPWVSKNPPPNSGKHLLRRFHPNGKYWYPRLDPVFTDPRIHNFMPADFTWMIWEYDGNSYVQLADFPRMKLKRNTDTWGWELHGSHTRYTTIGLADDPKWHASSEDADA
jgi:hypothetical protein